MKNSILFALTFFLLLVSFKVSAQQTPINPWQEKDLMAPAKLAEQMTTPKDAPLVVSIGPAALITGSIDIGPASEKENLEKLHALLAKQPKDKAIVIYCGCCPFEHCPNVRPAFTLLKELKLTNAKLLNLTHNIRTDWIDKGYPTNQ